MISDNAAGALFANAFRMHGGKTDDRNARIIRRETVHSFENAALKFAVTHVAREKDQECSGTRNLDVQTPLRREMAVLVG